MRHRNRVPGLPGILIVVFAACSTAQAEDAAWLVAGMNPPEGTFVAGTRHDFALTCEVKRPLAAGSQVRVVPPVRRMWSLPTLDAPKPAQANLSQVTWRIVQSERPGAKLTGDVQQYTDRGPPYGDRDPYRQVVLKVEGNELRPGDKVEIVFHQSRVCADTAHKDPARNVAAFRLQVKPAGEKGWNDVAGLPIYRLLPPPAMRVQVRAPSQVVKGEPFTICVTALDFSQNPTPDYAGVIRLESDDPGAKLPAQAQVRGTTHGTVVIENVVLSQPGQRKIIASAAEPLPEPSTDTALIEVLDAPPPLRMYWGELHSHGALSFDARNWGGCSMRPADMFWYARNVQDLDFAAVTDHSMHSAKMPQQNMTEPEFKEAQAAAHEANDPGRFVAFTACESRCPRGDTNVFFLGDSDAYYMKDRLLTVQELWQFYRGAPIVTIPHMHPPINSPGRFDAIDPEKERLIEIHSNHGRYEFDKNEPLFPQKGMVGGNNVQAILARGHRLGIVAASDDHSGRPGMSDLTVIYARERTREALFEALRARHTYGTTGARINIRFRMGENMMGDEVRVKRGDALWSSRPFTAEVVGTDVLENIEVVRNGNVIYSTAPKAVQCAFSYADTTPFDQCWLGTEKNNPPTAYYYLRVTQRRADTGVRRGPHMAWTSPIFLSPAE